MAEAPHLSTSEVVVQALKDKGLRVTPQRCAVYANLLTRSDHPTVEQILEEVNSALPISSKATVYASLQALREVGLVREVILEGGVSRFDANIDPHHHFRCDQCGSIEDIEWETLGLKGLDRVRPGLLPTRYEVTVQGLCEQCRSPIRSSI
ncbi:MAG: transcriptional repressor [Synechococcaceae cyanobacterium SM2_3_1]|nr:transcriptional repressor [Synechococcaceae cyanobacterium SM2_3_1]